VSERECVALGYSHLLGQHLDIGSRMFFFLSLFSFPVDTNGRRGRQQAPKYLLYRLLLPTCALFERRDLNAGRNVSACLAHSSIGRIGISSSDT